MVHLLPSTSQSAPVQFALAPNANGIALHPHLAPDVYFAAYDVAEPYDRVFLVETYQVFAGLQSLAALDEQEQQLAGAYSRIASLLRSKILDQIARLQTQDDTPLETLVHLKGIYQTFYLGQILFLPADDALSQAISEDLVHWVNTCDPAPSREQGLELASMAQPYDSDLFWSYLPRCILRGLFKAALTLMSSLQDHAVAFVRKGARITCQLLQAFPRASTFASLDDFSRSCHVYRRSVREAIRDIENEYDDDALWSAPSKRSKASSVKEDVRIEWLARFLTILKLLNGDQDTVIEHAEDWKEALAAWALLVRPTIAREDIAETIDQILDHEHIQMNLDDPLLAAQHALLLGHTAKAMSKCAARDLWLATHLTDLLEKSGAMEHDPEEPTTFRDWFIFRYSDQLCRDPGLWRVAIHYLSFTGHNGKAAIKQILLRVAFDLDHIETPSDEKGTQRGATTDTSVITKVEDVIQASYDYALPDVADTICQIAAERLLRARQYGRAVAYIVQSGDTNRMAAVTDALVEEYMLNGQEEFAALVDSIPTRLLRPGTLASDASQSQENHRYALFADQIAFLAQYRDFHAFFAQGARVEAAKLLVGLLASGIVPKHFRGVLLFDAIPLLEEDEPCFDAPETYELMRCLQDLELNNGTTADLVPLGRLVSRSAAGKQKRTEKEWAAAAGQQLKVIRLALARNLSRVLIAA